jgi:hypothetical protein
MMLDFNELTNDREKCKKATNEKRIFCVTVVRFYRYHRIQMPPSKNKKGG